MMYGWCVWISGLPGSGKSVISEYLSKKLEKKQIHLQLLSSDSLRSVLTPKPTYSSKERHIVYSTLVFITRLLVQNNVNVILDATGSLKHYRNDARNKLPKFIEVYLECPLKICIHRENMRKKTYGAPKNIYKKTFNGTSINVPRLNHPFELSSNPELIINTVQNNLAEAAKIIADFIFSRYYF